MTGPTIAGPLDSETVHPRYDPSLASPTSPSSAFRKLSTTSTAASPLKPTPTGYSPSALMGLAASALEQPGDEDPAQKTESSTFSKPGSTKMAHNNLLRNGTQAPPSLRVSTNMSAVNNTERSLTTTTATPIRRLTDSATPTPRSALPNSATGQSSSAVGALLSQNRQVQVRPNNGYAGKRPNMRDVMMSQPEMTEFEKEARSRKIRDIIKDQFSLEVLLKHRELQDIEAEMGKAEACLEQIRRCSIEASMEKDGHYDDMSGMQAAYNPSPSVVNGPYSREFGDWMLEDRAANGGRYHDVLAKDQSRNFVIGRRAARPEPAVYSKRPQREVAQQQIMKKPNVCLHRQADGSILKLTCLDCRRSDFGSAQGFINHCRLAHHREFVNHDAAAAACGTPFDLTGYEGPLPAPRSNRGLKNTGTTPYPKAARKNADIKKASKVSNKKSGSKIVQQAPPSIPTIAQNGPLTPPLQAEDMSLPKTIQTSHLKDYLSMKRVDVDNLDMMVEEAVNRVGMVDESEGEDDEVIEVQKVEENVDRVAVDVTASMQNVGAEMVQENVAVTEHSSHQDFQSPSVDIKMVDTEDDNSLSVEPADNAVSTNSDPAPEVQVLDSAFQVSQETTKSLVTSNFFQANTPEPQTQLEEHDEEAEQPRPTSSSSRRSAMSRSSPRTPVAPSSTRMATRGHPLPTVSVEISATTRHSARLAETGKPLPTTTKRP